MTKQPISYKKFFYIPDNSFNGYLEIYKDYIIIKYIGMSINWTTSVRIEKLEIEKVYCSNDFEIPAFFRMINSFYRAGKKYGIKTLIATPKKDYKITILFDKDDNINSIIKSINNIS